MSIVRTPYRAECEVESISIRLAIYTILVSSCLVQSNGDFHTAKANHASIPPRTHSPLLRVRSLENVS